MAKANVRFTDLTAPPPLGPGVEVETAPVTVLVLDQPDKSDPLDGLLVVALQIGNRCGASISVNRTGDANEDLRTAIAGMILVATENAAEIRDAIAMEKADGCR